MWKFASLQLKGCWKVTTKIKQFTFEFFWKGPHGKKKLNIFPKISQPRLGFRTCINCPSASLFVSHLARAERGERCWGSGDLSAGSHRCCLCPGREYQQLFRKEHAKFLQKAAPEGKPGRPSPRRHFGSFSEVTEGLRAEAAQVESPVLWPWSVLCRAAHMEHWGSLYWQNTQNQSLVSCLVVLGFCLFFSAHQSNSGINILIRLHHRITQIVSLHFLRIPSDKREILWCLMADCPTTAGERRVSLIARELTFLLYANEISWLSVVH